MIKAFRLIPSFLLIACFAGLAAAHGADERLDIADFAGNPEAFSGRNIEVNDRVIAIIAYCNCLVLFDSQSNTRISVRLTQLRKAERVALMRSDVRRVLVSGRASVVGGRLTIDAQRVEPVALTRDKVVDSKDADHSQR